jgi:uncharacterized protein YndB with AHSA1/START domain
VEFEVIRQTTLLEASPEEVYEAYVDPKKHAAFTGSKATGSPKVGGKFTAWDGYIEGKYTELVRGKKIVHEWMTSEWPSGYPPSVIEIVLRRSGGKTKLTFVQKKVPAEQAEEYRQGWIDNYWEPMKRYFEDR